MRINNEIKSPNVRLIDEKGEQLGVVTFSSALSAAEEAGLDLVEVNPKADPPVCRIIDWGKFRYEQKKKLQKSKKVQATQEIKGIRLSVKIGKHDFDTKLTRAKKFLEKGNKLQLQLRFKGREMAHPELGQKVLQDFAVAMGEVIIEQQPKMQGRAMNMTVAPKKK